MSCKTWTWVIVYMLYSTIFYLLTYFTYFFLCCLLLQLGEVCPFVRDANRGSTMSSTSRLSTMTGTWPASGTVQKHNLILISVKLRGAAVSHLSDHTVHAVRLVFCIGTIKVLIIATVKGNDGARPLTAMGKWMNECWAETICPLID